MDLGEILTRSWKITWQRKTLWWVGLINALMMLGWMMASLFTNPIFSVLWSGNLQYMENIEFEQMALNLVFTFGFIILMYPVAAFTLTAITVGVLRAERVDNDPTATGTYDQDFSFSSTVRESMPFFWRVLGLMMVYLVTLLAIMAVLWVCMMGAMILTLGLGAMCIIPFELLLMPLTYFAVAWLEQAELAVIVENLGVAAAIRRGWFIVKNNLWNMVLMVLVLYLGLGMITSILMMPMMLPFFMLPFSMATSGEIDPTFMRILMIVMFAYMPVVAFIQIIVLIFTKAAWALNFLGLTRKENAPLPDEIHA